MEGEIISQIWSAGAVIIIGVSGYLAKRAINRTDKYGVELEEIKTNYATKAEVKDVEEKLAKDIEKLETNVKNDIGKMEKSINDNLKIISDDIKDLQINSISKEDLHRQMTGFGKEVDRIIECIGEGKR